MMGATMVFLAREWVNNIDEFQAIEQWFGVDDPLELTARYDNALGALADKNMGTWLGHGIDAGISEESMAHFQSDWLDGTGITDCDADTMAERFRAGFEAALTDARDSGLKTSIIGLNAGDEFRIDHVVGTNAVTVVVSVPAISSE
jgi:hypothetical protein